MKKYFVTVSTYYESDPMAREEAEKVFSEKVKEFNFVLIDLRDAMTCVPVKSAFNGKVYDPNDVDD